MMNRDPGMCDIICGSDPICYDSCLYGGGGGGTGGGGGGGGGRCAICFQDCETRYLGAVAGCFIACLRCGDDDVICEAMCASCQDKAESNHNNCIAGCYYISGCAGSAGGVS